MSTRAVRVREDAEKRFKRKTEDVAHASRAAADYAAAHQGALTNMARLKALRMARDTGAAATKTPAPAPKMVARATPARPAPLGHRRKRASPSERATS
ncbi:hypothetical protein [Rhodoplanes sp. SY1]|uniref:hypothetical protein n=1 Tax=Rhodoplanes sp. SY1 TaxID=3166646 RepID=UPI0038B4C7C1